MAVFTPKQRPIPAHRPFNEQVGEYNRFYKRDFRTWKYDLPSLDAPERYWLTGRMLSTNTLIADRVLRLIADHERLSEEVERLKSQLESEKTNGLFMELRGMLNMMPDKAGADGE